MTSEHNARTVPILRIYTAGPYRAADAYQRELHIRVAEQAALEILRLGALPICPHTMFRFFQDAIPDAWALRAGLALIQQCDALLLLPGHARSLGTQAEQRFAHLRGLPVFDGLDALRFWIMASHRQGTAVDLRLPDLDPEFWRTPEPLPDL